MMKRILSAFFVAVIICYAPFYVSAASSEAESAANELHELGLFGGVGTNVDGTINYDLDRTPTRAEAVTMLVRLLGKDDVAKTGHWEIPFTDVAKWAEPYVGYAYANGLTGGIGGGLFGSSSEISATQYLTFLLRALDYSSETDFQWDKAWELTDKIGITHGEYGTAGVIFTRGDMAIVSRNALYCNKKDTEISLIQHISRQIQHIAQSEDYTISRIDFSFAAPKAGEDIFSYDMMGCCVTEHATAYWVSWFELPSNSIILQKRIEYNVPPEFSNMIEWEATSGNGVVFESGKRYCCVISVMLDDGYCFSSTCDYYYNGTWFQQGSQHLGDISDSNIIIDIE